MVRGGTWLLYVRIIITPPPLTVNKQVTATMDDDVKVNEELCPFCGAKEFDGYPVDRYLTHFICHSCCKEWVD